MYIIFLSGAVILAAITIAVIARSFTLVTRQTQADIIASLPNPLFGIDKKALVTLCNPAAEKFLGKTRQEIIGQHIDTILPLSQNNALLPFADYKNTLQTEIPSSPSFVFTTQQGTTRHLHITAAPLEKQTMLLTLHDSAKEQQLEEMKVDFVSMAAHELRTPLTAIRGYTSLLQMHYASKLDDSAKELLTRLLVSTNNMTNLIDNLLSVSRIERNDMTIDAKPVDLSFIIKDIFQSFEQQAKTRRQKFSLHIPDKLPLVNVDPFRIGQALINLISNAINYTPEEGTVSVTVTDDASSLIVAVKDSGEGIPVDAMPRLFTKFFRVSGSLEQGSKGTGLGLYITKSIIDMHNGKIWAESTVGKGSTFTFTIPHASQDAQASQNQSSSIDFLTVKNAQGIIVKKNI